mmetsp:Transcript_47494/g.137168  ORF Transcript_47494/g.137168 Transcript_47494/m.137168 type:complete len:593 (-) Transcript_47494:1436-3214(-)
MPSLWLLACGLILGTQGSSSEDLDAVALVQRGSADAPSMTVTAAETVGPLKVSAKGPVAMTELGPVQGLEMPDHFVFRGIPYVEPPQRFQRAMPKKPWAPNVLQAREYPRACIGSGTGSESLESEDCLNLNIWMPKGGRTDMPVIVYFHGGMNMHGAGAEPLRQGDGVVLSEKYPTIFVNFDYRLGIFGWIYTEPDSGVPNSLGIIDQQEALRWVQENIAAFGGDPTKVALMGQSEGAGNIMNHVISPASAGLFWRAIFHSPPAEVWSYEANIARTDAMVASMKCKRSTMQETVQCLRRIPAAKLFGADWTPEELSRMVGSPKWFKTMFSLASFTVRTGSYNRLGHYLGWHAVPDGNVIPGEAHDLLPLGKFNKVPILLTVSKNESYGITPDAGAGSESLVQSTLSFIMKSSETQQVMQAYNASLLESGIKGTTAVSLLHQMLTDKMWTCEAWTFAKEVTQGGGSVQLGGFWKSPRWDPVGGQSNHLCTQGATCHAAEMMYSLPQGRNVGIHGDSKEMKEELAFALRYRDEVLSFVHGFQGPWEPYRSDREVITLYDENGPRVVEGYRKKQCAILDKSWADSLPAHMRRRAL